MINTLEKFFEHFRTYDLARIPNPTGQLVGCFHDTCEKLLPLEDAMTLNVGGVVFIGCRAHIRAEMVEQNLQAPDDVQLESIPLIPALQVAIKNQRRIAVCRDLLRDRGDAYTLEQLKQRCAGKPIMQQANHLHAGEVNLNWVMDYESRMPLATKALEAWNALRQDFETVFRGIPWNDRWDTVTDDEFESLTHWREYVQTVTAFWIQCAFPQHIIEQKIRERRGPFMPTHPFFTVRIVAGMETFRYFLVDKIHGEILTDLLYRDNKKYREETGRIPDDEREFRSKVMSPLDSTLHRF